MKVMDFDRARCAKVAGRLDAYVSNELSVETSQQVAEHLDACSECSRELESRLKLRRLVKHAVQGQQAPAAVELRLRESLRSKASRPSFGPWTIPLAAVAALLITVSVGWVQHGRAPEPWQTAKADQEAYIESLYTQVAKVVRIGLGDHAHCAHYRKFPETPPAASAMAELLGEKHQGLLDLVSARIPEGFRILLGHQCKFRGRQYVHMALGRNEELLSVIITRREPDESFERDNLVPVLQAAGVPVYTATADRFEIAGFENEDYLVFVISNLHREENLRIARILTPELDRFLQRVEG